MLRPLLTVATKLVGTPALHKWDVAGPSLSRRLRCSLLVFAPSGGGGRCRVDIEEEMARDHEMRKPSFEIYVSANLCPLDGVNGTKLSVYMWG
jgi:hypothetical protein